SKHEGIQHLYIQGQILHGYPLQKGSRHVITERDIANHCKRSIVILHGSRDVFHVAKVRHRPATTGIIPGPDVVLDTAVRPDTSVRVWIPAKVRLTPACIDE